MSKRAPFEETEAARPPFDKTAEFTVTQTPNVAFRPGGGLNDVPCCGRAADFHTVNPETYDTAKIYKLMVSAITPRPIAFMSTLSASGEPNIAPFSFFNMVSSDPPTIMISISTQGAKMKGGSWVSTDEDTIANVRETGQFCASIISEDFVEAANYTAVDSPHGVDEWALSGLTPRASEAVKPPYVAESAFSMECELSHLHDIKNDDGVAPYTLILGRVRRIHVKDAVLDPDEADLKVSTRLLKPVSRLGGLTFARVSTGFDLQRPRWDDIKDSEEVRQLTAAGPRV